ncbi:MAG TPA: hypothetical protein VK213_13555 [Bacteroidales bacterium]|nr:hypothetical protein [Bacteroidales bacterium]
MIEPKYSKFDWDAFINDLSNKTPELQDLIFQNTKKKYLKENPDFSGDFIKRLKEVSFNQERKQYYEENNTSSEDIETFENSFGVYVSNLDKDVQLKVGSEFWKMLKWAAGSRTQESKMSLTRLWFSGPDFNDKPVSQVSKLDVRERLYMLYLLQKYGYLKDSQNKLMVNNKANKFFLSQLLDIKPGSFGHPLDDLSGTFKFDRNSSIQFFSEKIPSIKRLIEVFENSIYLEPYSELRDTLEIFETEKKRLSKKLK